MLDEFNDKLTDDSSKVFICHDCFDNQIEFNTYVHSLSNNDLLSIIPLANQVQWYEYEKVKKGKVIGKANNCYQVETTNHFGDKAVLNINPLYLVKNLGALSWVPGFLY